MINIKFRLYEHLVMRQGNISALLNQNKEVIYMTGWADSNAYGGNIIYLFNVRNENFFVVFEGAGRFFFKAGTENNFLPRSIHIEGGPEAWTWFEEECKETVHSFKCGDTCVFKNIAEKALDPAKQAVLEQVLFEIHKFDLDQEAILAKEISAYAGTETYMEEVTKEDYEKLVKKDLDTINKMTEYVLQLVKNRGV